jgi:hypothetical protein
MNYGIYIIISRHDFKSWSQPLKYMFEKEICTLKKIEGNDKLNTIIRENNLFSPLNKIINYQKRISGNYKPNISKKLTELLNGCLTRFLVKYLTPLLCINMDPKPVVDIIIKFLYTETDTVLAIRQLFLIHI